ncbi:hypothetical protein RHSIM_Rhsim05G0184000 [Rhododendron simsii]|uniref:Uncharacterized protein n=1 Tax=Rhododendron simsii TaxID=118357 RepID=A0A834H906_RHOSS|nr:hypothetical protein RHSIM_Rhsim05G0184000 [Rhododendron simsii]
MADKCTMSLLEAMDCLWFHQVVVLSVPSLLVIHKTLQTPVPTSDTLTYSSSNTSQLSLPGEDISSAASSFTTPSEDDCSDQQEIVENKEAKQNPKQPTRLNTIITTKSRAHSSSSPSNRSHRKKRLRSYTGSVRRLEKTMSCKTLEELELEEVKGFIDLGFEFKKENLSPRMLSVVPGLQRFGSWDVDHDEERNGTAQDCDHEIIEEGEEEERGVMRPYLSEAWIENRPEWGFANIRLPRVSAAGDMKKLIRCWARTVASVIRQES